MKSMLEINAAFAGGLIVGCLITYALFMALLVAYGRYRQRRAQNEHQAAASPDVHPDEIPYEGGLVKVTVYFTQRSMRALEESAMLAGDSKTDTINRAVQLYLFLVGSVHIGQRIFFGKSPHQLTELDVSWFRGEPQEQEG